MCRTHVVWIKCGEIETETLGKAKAHLLPLVIPVISAWSLQSNCSILVSMLASAYMEASGCCRGVQPAAYSVCRGPAHNRLYPPTVSEAHLPCLSQHCQHWNTHDPKRLQMSAVEDAKCNSEAAIA